MTFSHSIQQPSFTTFCGKPSDDFIIEVHLLYTHIADVHAEQKGKEAAHLHLIKSHCDARAKKFVRSLPERQKATAADLVAAPESTLKSADEEESREIQAHRAMLELEQRKEEILATYARRARRVADHIDTKHDYLFAIKFRDGFRSKSLRRRLSICDAAGNLL